jgi:dTDP-4-amino-4,6-dideoxygalactose transaminase
VTYTGARPVFADIAATHRPWPGSAELEAVLTPRTKAIVAVPYAGETEPSSGVIEFAAEHGLTLIEDAAHALGATVGGRHVGTFGQVGAYSLFSNKPLATGEGGLVVTQRPDWAERMRLLRSHGMSRSTWERHHASVPSYDVLAVGFNYRIDEPRAALALSRLRRLESDRLARTRLVARYRGGLEGLEQIVPAIGSGTAGASTHHLFPVLVAEGVDRDGLRARLAEAGIQTSLHYPPVHRTSAYGRLSARLPRTEDYARRTLTLPLFAHLTHHQQDMVLHLLRRCA